jgi:hypothetical protein
VAVTAGLSRTPPDQFEELKENYSPRQSIFSVPDDYKMNDPAGKAVPLAPTETRRTRRRTMKYVCLGYIAPGTFERMTEDERNAVLDECFEHNDHLRASGHLATELPLQPPESAVTVSWKNGQVATTDGPYAETKEQLGGIQILEARDLNHAIQLVSQLPGFRYGLGPIEIRPIVELSGMIKESEQRGGENILRDEGGQQGEHESKNDQGASRIASRRLN